MKRVDVASAIIFNETGEKIVLVKNQRGNSYFWSVPGGAVESGETLEEAAVRETKEEAGLDIEITGLHSVREARFSERGHHAVLFHFYGKIVGGELEIRDPDAEVKDVVWMELDEANTLMDYLPESHKIKSREKQVSVPYHFQRTV